MHTTIRLPLLLASLLSVGAITRAADKVSTTDAQDSASPPAVMKFSDPSKPGTVRLRLAWGDVAVTAADTKEVTIVSNIKAKQAAAKRTDGLRRLDSEVTYSAAEKDNVITLVFGTDLPGAGRSGAKVQLTVPRQTNVVVQNSFGGDIDVKDLVGDVEIRNMNGGINLAGISGAALVDTMNGEIHATFSKVSEGKALSFTSMNGEIDVRIPEDTKANVRLRTQNGAVYTDFDEKALITHTEAARGRIRHSGRTLVTQHNGSDWSDDVREIVRDAIHTGFEAAREGIEAAKEAAAAAHEAAAAAHEGAAEANDTPIPPVPPMPPMPPVMPSVSGGKVVSGTLNGGGPDLYIATMNGAITLRKTQP